MSLHWAVQYDDTNHGQLKAVGPTHLWSIRHSDGKWLLSSQRKGVPGPYKVETAENKLDACKEWANGFEFGHEDIFA
jgi:hypothetical protein